MEIKNNATDIEQFDAKNDVLSMIKKRKSMEEFMLNIDLIIEEITKNPSIINDFNDDEIIEIHKKLNPYNSTIVNDKNTKYTCLSYTNLREEYLEKLLTTSLIGFLFRLNDEYEIDEEYLTEEIDEAKFVETVPNPNMGDTELVASKTNELTYNKRAIYLQSKSETPLTHEDVTNGIDSIPDDVELSIQAEVKNEIETELYKPLTSVNKLKLSEYKETKIKEQSLEEQKIIKRFLNKYFEFNADNDVKCSYDKKSAVKDSSRDEINKIYKDFETKEDIIKAFDERMDSDNRTLLKRNTKSLSEEELFKDKIPSKDIYHRFHNYYEINYETLRKSVKDIYGLTPDLEIAFNIYDQFNSLEEAEAFIDKNKKTVITSIKTVTNNNWVFTGPFEQNMDKRKFYNENTVVLENILKQMEDDAQMANTMMKDRVKKKKMKNIKEMGEDDPKFTQYKKEYSDHLKLQGASDIDLDEFNKKKIIRIIQEEEFNAESNEKVDEDGCPLDAVEIKVTHINAKTNETNVENVYTKKTAPTVVN